MPRRVLHARWLLPFVIAVALVALWRSTRATRWHALAPGVEFGTIPGEPYCRLGSSAVAVLRIDPRHARLRVRHYARLAPPRMRSILEWQRAEKALAVFNAGQYYPDFRYMGLLVSDGDTVSSRPHAGFQAALVAADGRADVLDLARTPLDRAGRWSDVAQSFMLFDRDGGVRVRKSDRIANRTVVGVDSRGAIVVCVSEGAYTLTGFAELLMRSKKLALVHAMSMDGGLESELVVKSPTFRYASFGDWSDDRDPTAPGALVPLPAVITLEAK